MSDFRDRIPTTSARSRSTTTSSSNCRARRSTRWNRSRTTSTTSPPKSASPRSRRARSSPDQTRRRGRPPRTAPTSPFSGRASSRARARSSFSAASAIAASSRPCVPTASAESDIPSWSPDRVRLVERVLPGEHAPHLGLVDLLGPRSDQHGGDGVAREVRDGTAFGHEPVDARRSRPTPLTRSGR